VLAVTIELGQVERQLKNKEIYEGADGPGKTGRGSTVPMPPWISTSPTSGGRIYPLIMEARPDLKVIVCSGYSIHGPAQATLDAGAEGFMQKPFSIAPFADKLKEVLEGK
jgi:DNA-binding NarL/FixJ family response regulator